jgi:hypothetical protein
MHILLDQQNRQAGLLEPLSLGGLGLLGWRTKRKEQAVA